MTHSMELTPDGPHGYVVSLPESGMSYRVRVPESLLEELGLEAAEEERLVRASFDFLLEREPASSILRRFDLEVIESYFPGYLAEMRKRLTTG